MTDVEGEFVKYQKHNYVAVKAELQFIYSLCAMGINLLAIMFFQFLLSQYL